MLKFKIIAETDEASPSEDEEGKDFDANHREEGERNEDEDEDEDEGDICQRPSHRHKPAETSPKLLDTILNAGEKPLIMPKNSLDISSCSTTSFQVRMPIFKMRLGFSRK